MRRRLLLLTPSTPRGDLGASTQNQEPMATRKSSVQPHCLLPAKIRKGFAKNNELSALTGQADEVCFFVEAWVWPIPRGPPPAGRKIGSSLSPTFHW